LYRRSFSNQSSNHDFNILFLFSFLFSLSTLFLCIVSANFSYLAFSSFAARLSLMACTLLYIHGQFNCPVACLRQHNSSARQGEILYLSFSLLLLLHLLLFGFDDRDSFSLFSALLVRCDTARGTESLLGFMPLLAFELSVRTTADGAVDEGTILAHALGHILRAGLRLSNYLCGRHDCKCGMYGRAYELRCYLWYFLDAAR
jgi:hypothetical protein